jgi:hypothetical protein
MIYVYIHTENSPYDCVKIINDTGAIFALKRKRLYEAEVERIQHMNRILQTQCIRMSRVHQVPKRSKPHYDRNDEKSS